MGGFPVSPGAFQLNFAGGTNPVPEADLPVLALGAAFIAMPFAHWFGFDANIHLDGPGWIDWSAPWVWPLSIVVGIVLVIAMLHLARLVGHLHGKLAKTLLVSNRAW